MSSIASVDDLQALAQRRLPRMLYDYVAAGSWSQLTRHANRADLDAITLRQRVAVDVAQRSTRSTLLGMPVAMPVALAPTGLAGLLYPEGERLAARAAAAFGVPFILSMMSISSLEQVCAGLSTPCWFQLYLLRDRGFCAALIARAEAVGCGALVLTLDVPFMAQRHADHRNGLRVPPRLSLAALCDFAAHPRWCWRMRGRGRWDFGNLAGQVDARGDLASLAAWTASQFDAALSWDDVAWVRARWRGPLVLKGILDEEDARQAVAAGADALVVSNHGGRQLDGASSSIARLPAILAAVDGAVEVHMDSGIRCGQDVLKALASGARGTYIGRAWLYGLAALGEAGVTQVLQLIQRELELSMGLCGRPQIADIDASMLLNAR
ncbi:alpha-hydroxy acid oxidase [Xanthomonas maliensis]|uniref:alpha-hydroxy acid oxidase n=1 Tax=Xanthomonas maliensis TaxID=1321368 RepID=UPI0003A44C82|nr:alpha-hydroxy acid oxidase [Xanthomonas maliensis]KAB7763059.1 alpha-hydroxy-acid oxidizing protein [Xanthomonas maliensis]